MSVEATPQEPPITPTITPKSDEILPQIHPKSTKCKSCLKCCGITFVIFLITFGIFTAVMGGIVSNLSKGNRNYTDY